MVFLGFLGSTLRLYEMALEGQRVLLVMNHDTTPLPSHLVPSRRGAAVRQVRVCPCLQEHPHGLRALDGGGRTWAPYMRPTGFFRQKAGSRGCAGEREEAHRAVNGQRVYCTRWIPLVPYKKHPFVRSFARSYREQMVLTCL